MLRLHSSDCCEDSVKHLLLEPGQHHPRKRMGRFLVKNPPATAGGSDLTAREEFYLARSADHAYTACAISRTTVHTKGIVCFCKIGCTRLSRHDLFARGLGSRRR
jgi:hypothetical protein